MCVMEEQIVLMAVMKLIAQVSEKSAFQMSHDF